VTFELLISANPYGIRAAEVADGQVRAFHVESADQPSRIGDICFATCTRPMPALGGAFFDAGFAEPVFMSRAGSVKAGDGMLVQISADATLGKGMRVTRHLSLAGRLVVLEPAGKGGAPAASLDGDTALQALATTLATDLGVRVTLRSAAAGADHAAIEAEAKRLSACWDDLCDSQKTKPGVLHQAGGLLGRLLRDVARPDIARITIGDPACHKRALALADVEASDLSDRIFQHDGDGDLFERYDCSSMLEDACGETHALPSGGCLYIEQTRAMVTIDVDSGSNSRPSRGWTD
jgi:Rne/Rng family ribonuclease